MSYSDGFIVGLKGTAEAVGPSADTVLVVAQRISVVVQDLESLRLRLVQLDRVDWNSAAAAAFRKSLAEDDASFMVVKKQIGTAIDRLTSYSIYLRTASDAATAGSANWWINPGLGAGWNSTFGMAGVQSEF